MRTGFRGCALVDAPDAPGAPDDVGGAGGGGAAVFDAPALFAAMRSTAPSVTPTLFVAFVANSRKTEPIPPWPGAGGRAEVSQPRGYFDEGYHLPLDANQSLGER